MAENESICSNMSHVTVSAFGQNDVPIDEAVDDIFKKIQSSINDLHCQIRQLCMSEDRGDTYEEAYQFQHAIKEHVDESIIVFKELVKVMKQILPKRPKDLPKDFEKNYNPKLAGIE